MAPPAAPLTPPAAPPAPLRFSRQELAGAFGDLGTDLPLLVGVVLATGMDAPMAFLLFGALQVASGLAYRLPMPVQPLKAMAAIAIAGRLAPPVLAAGGIVVGAVMLLLARIGALAWLARTVPKPVVRGIQVGLAIQLGTLALTRFLPADGARGWLVGAVALAAVLALRTNRRVPAALVVVGAGAAWALATWPAAQPLPWGFHAPSLPARWPTPAEFAQGALLLALPQLALSLGNSVLATQQVVRDLFPERPPLGVRTIGTTYALMNLAAAPLGGLPVCHGSGGMAGHYAFGARTGGSVVLYGAFLIGAGLFLAGDPAAFQRLFPAPVLGTLLLVEAAAVLWLVRDQVAHPRALLLALACGAAAWLPYGYAVALAGGTVAWRVAERLAPRHAGPRPPAEVWPPASPR